MLKRLYNDESGVLTFEWILLITVLVIGIVGALSAVRDAINTELGDVAEAMVALDQSYYICWPWEVGTPDEVVDGASNSFFVDGAYIYQARVDDAKKFDTCEDDGQKPTQAIEAFNDQAPSDGSGANFTVPTT
ncbi:MAG: hypothetical protein IJK97_11435 [Thermoguttaceae bacterium]|nr:hypothetical protein [Thermoguttaceae bacterium]MBR0192652.1 hypothetical protein [Thermoguttaceae bacterium]